MEINTVHKTKDLEISYYIYEVVNNEILCTYYFEDKDLWEQNYKDLKTLWKDEKYCTVSKAWIQQVKQK